MTRTILFMTLLFLLGCDQILPNDGVGEFLGLKFGVPLNLKIKDGPREAPVTAGHLDEFYEVEYPNMEFTFVGVAVTKNNEWNRKNGMFFNQENIIWGAYFYNKKPCNEEGYMRIKKYLETNWKVTSLVEERNEPGNDFFMEGTFISSYIIFSITCHGEYGLSPGSTITIRDLSVLRESGDNKTKEAVDKSILDVNTLSKRRM